MLEAMTIHRFLLVTTKGMCQEYTARDTSVCGQMFKASHDTQVMHARCDAELVMPTSAEST